jgi:hypothetical protein
METDKGIQPASFGLAGVRYQGTLHLIEDEVWRGTATILGCTQKEFEPHTSIFVYLADGREGLGMLVSNTMTDESQPDAPRVRVSLLGSGKLAAQR